LREHGLITRAELATALAGRLRADAVPLFDHVVVDEAQDMDVPQLRLLAALAGGRPNGLFFAGDLGQRIFRQPFSWRALGVDIRGRSRTLRVNYRTSHQIRTHADRLLGARVADVDGNVEERGGTVSVFNGPRPRVLACDGPEAEQAAVADWLRRRTADGIDAREIAVFVRSAASCRRSFSATSMGQALRFPSTVASPSRRADKCHTSRVPSGPGSRRAWSKAWRRASTSATAPGRPTCCSG
jgi:superfamily I DNA/RNA helicase